MKKLLAILAATAFLGLAACQPAEEEPVENAFEETGDAVEEGWDETTDAVEDGWDETTDAVDDATEMEDVNDEELGDDEPPVE